MSLNHVFSHRMAALLAFFRARKLWLVVLAILTCVVLVLALMPKPPDYATLGWDKLNHATAFAALAVSGWWGVPRLARARLLLMLGLLALGALIEVLQSFVPGRDASVYDLLADAVGLTVGAVLGAITIWAARRCGAPNRH